MRDYIVTLLNKEGDKRKLTVQASSKRNAEHLAVEGANSGGLPGQGWIALDAEVAK